MIENINLDNIDGNTARQIESVENGIVNEVEAYQERIGKLLGTVRKMKEVAAAKARRDFEEMTKDYIDIKEKLFDFPDRIKDQKEHILGLEEFAQEAEQELQVMEDMELMQISNATDEGGKKKYSNKEAREAALNFWKSDDEEYQEQLKQVKSAQRDLENARFDLDRIYNEYKSYQKVADMMTARMNMFVG